MSMDYNDWYSVGLSSCCGAAVINPAGDDEWGICDQCREHCEIITEGEE